MNIRATTALIALLLGSVCQTVCLSQETDSSATVDFYRDVWPILQSKCIACHGGDDHSGGLQLDSQPNAAKRGDSRLPILGGDLNTNQIYVRTSLTDPAARMPKSGPPLSEAEMSMIQRWVEAGSPWPPPPAAAATPNAFNSPEVWNLYYADFTTRYKAEIAICQPYLYALLALLIAMFIRARAFPGDVHPTGRIARMAFSVRISHLLIGALLLAIGAGTSVASHRETKLSAEVAQWRAAAGGINDRELFGTPPIPIRPSHAKRIEGVYYRGNCERHPSLFNGGNYRTATFRISLCDNEFQPLKLGDGVPKDGPLLRFEMARAPQATKVLFSPEIISSIYLCSEFQPKDQSVRPQAPVKRLATLEADQRWVGYYPLGQPDSDGKLSMLVYVSKGVAEEGELVRGEPHFGIQCDLRIRDGRLAEGSELWMGALYLAANVTRPRRDQISYEEWFGWQPIPEITGQNATEPELLGVPEHVNKDVGDTSP